MPTTYRACLIGCGSIAHGHVYGYQGLDNVEIVAIADPVKEALDQFGERHGIGKRYTDARQMLDEEHPDIVSVCTWHKLHAPLTIASCARRPKAVLCEKPMATSLGECDEMLIAARRNKVKLAIAHQRRFNPAWTEARNLVLSGAIGQPRQVIAKGGQGLLNDCSHLFDMMRYVMGDPDAEWVIGNVERKTDRYERDMRIEDRSAGIIQFNNGAIGLLLQELAGPNYQGGIFYGTDGILELDEQKVRLLSGRSGAWEEHPSQGEDPHIGQARELIEWIEGNVEHRGRAENGRAAVEIIMAIYESARMHEVVTMPVRTRCSPLDVMIEKGDLPVERPGRYDIRAFLLRGETMRPEET
ncbi:MAG: Gfo/Idh/MocA family oxidoreductase [Candidatus Latescibacteria bacterium]|nr:Gfo/Idh/MocA family oxidoreductase [Candidatus Latescibacterota bacterium]